MDTSIIIPSYGSEKTIKVCLGSLVTQSTAYSYEIILVDSSPDESVSDIAKKFPSIKFIKLKEKSAPGTARNAGIKEATGELLIFIDSDIVMLPGWLENAMGYYKAGHYIFTSAVDLWPEKRNSWIDRTQWFFEFSEFKPAMPEGTRWCLPACFLAIKKSLLNNIKFPDMQSCEDTELTVRLNKAGNTLYFNPALRAFHIFEARTQKLLKKALDFGFCSARVRVRHEVFGWKITRRKFLAIFAIPVFSFIKLIRISRRNLKYNNLEDKLLYTVTLPFIIILIFCWMLGFYKGALSG